ncbi:MAG: DUF1573 domain-containing protein [bacterium]|nr:DUF1573 domain-containing protein [bacterium]
MNKLLSVIVVLGLLFVGLQYVKKDSADVVQAEVTESSVASELIVDRASHDFGEIGLRDGVVSTVFIVTNVGDEDVAVINGTTSCGCTSAELQGVSFGMHQEMDREVVIPSGGSQELTVIYDPMAHGPSGVGLANRKVFLKTNSTQTPELSVDISALVVNK